MEITVLLENSSVGSGLSCAHGLSLFVEWGNRSVLIDTGPDNFFAVNAEKIGKDISSVNTAIISHGHRDHGGGLDNFLRANCKAKVYLHKNGMEPHWAVRPDGGLKDVGLDPALIEKHSGRIRLVDDFFKVDEEICLFSCHHISGKRPQMNTNLYKGSYLSLVNDDFDHEINTLIKAEGHTVLFVGCAHCGIANIIHGCKMLSGVLPDLVVGGFHLSSKGLGQCESEESIRRLAEELKALGCTYITGHCTGEKALEQLKESLGEELFAMSTGAVFSMDGCGHITRKK